MHKVNPKYEQVKQEVLQSYIPETFNKWFYQYGGCVTNDKEFYDNNHIQYRDQILLGYTGVKGCCSWIHSKQNWVTCVYKLTQRYAKMVNDNRPHKFIQELKYDRQDLENIWSKHFDE